LSFEKVVHVIGAPELLEDERFTGPVGRREHMGVFVDLVRAWVSERTLAEVTDLFEANDIPYGKVQSSQEVVTSPIMREREMLVDLDLPGAGLVPVLNTPFRSSRGKSRPQGPPPQLGQHTRDVLGELLGLGAAELDSLIEQGIIHTADRT
jgi:crotonobetainyl-CoA:carnitine CoA-transferase CaiB-like acyl-CoA transferase